MENYNLTAELKKIASGITTSDPNTELGNINSGVGNLDTAMQGVANAINGISIPNPGSNIDGVATAIGNISIPNPSTNIDGVATAITNKTIPDPSSNITAVATAVDNLAGGKDLGDIETILTTIGENIANLGSNWRYLGIATGTTRLYYPNTWQQLWIQVDGHNATWQNYDFFIIKEFITNPDRPALSVFRNGYHVSSTDYGAATVAFTSTQVYLNSFDINGTTYLSQATMRVYYK